MEASCQPQERAGESWFTRSDAGYQEKLTALQIKKIEFQFKIPTLQNI